jgi:hypothetical protein
MISIEEYNRFEAEARSRLPDLYKDNKWGIVPETQGHLVWVQELKGLQPLLNRFQCDRFRSYLYELGGLSKEDLALFGSAKNALISIQKSYYPEIEPIVPVETMLSALTIYRKIKTARPQVRTILEIGPGAGLNSLFFSCDENISNYTQIEATQATYLSQAMVNEACYGVNVWELAGPRSIGSQIVPSKCDRLWHVPWWGVDDLYNTSMYYDVITANACLNEISNEMVDRYLEIFQVKSRPNTLILLQDLGEWMNRNDVQLLEKFNNAGWFVNGFVENWDIERTIGVIGHGDAVSTWWLTKHPNEHVDKIIPRSADGSVVLRDSYSGFSYYGDDEVWTKDKLAKIA